MIGTPDAACGEGGEDDRFGGAVADGDGRQVGLGLDLVTGGDEFQDFGSGSARGSDAGGEEG